MTDSGRLIGRHSLHNGLNLELWDHSRPIAGDRWFVVVEARINVPVRADTLPPELKAQVGDVIAALGEAISFSQRDERNFIAASEAPILLKDMQERLLTMAPAYFGHANFAAGVIRRKWAAQQDLQGWQSKDNRTEQDT
jgi:hypothetical protein